MTEPNVQRDTKFWANQGDFLTAALLEALKSPLVKQIWIDLVQYMQYNPKKGSPGEQ